jgi:Extensin-like protein C-terminus
MVRVLSFIPMRRLAVLLCLLLPALFLAGCGLFQRAQRAAWRGQAEKQCMAENRVPTSDYIQTAAAIDGPGICGMIAPLKVTALLNGQVILNATQTINCPMTEALESWMRDYVQPLARARFHQDVVALSTMGAYACRNIDHKWGAPLSEHAYGNAIDIGSFTLADGHNIVVARAWSRGNEQEKAFLREAHASACGVFTTVLGPGADGYHTDHFHLDLALHAMTSTGPRRICKPLPSPQLLPAPKPRDDLPDPPDMEEELDIAQAQDIHHDGRRNGAPTYSPQAIASVLASVPPEPPHRPAAPEASTHTRSSDPLRAPQPVAPPPQLVYQPQRPITPQTPLPRSAALVALQKPAPQPEPRPQTKPRPQRLEPFDLDDVTSSIPRH